MVALTDEGRGGLLRIGMSLREIEVLEASLNHASNNQIGEKLFITQKTVKFHWTNIYKKVAVVTGKRGARSDLWIWLTANRYIANTREIVTYRATEPGDLIPGFKK